MPFKNLPFPFCVILEIRKRWRSLVKPGGAVRFLIIRDPDLSSHRQGTRYLFKHCAGSRILSPPISATLRFAWVSKRGAKFRDDAERTFSICVFVIIFQGLLPQANADEFIVDSPTPTAYQNVFVDLHSTLSQRKDRLDMNTPSMEAYLGVYPEYSIQVVTPVTLSKSKNKPPEYGYGDVRLGVKHRFIQETTWCPEMAFYPKQTFPSGDPERGIGNRTWTGTAPLWMQKKWDDLKVTWGGGYGFNPARNKFNFPFGGILFRYQFTKSLMLGNEIDFQGPRSLTDGSEVIYNFGGQYSFTPHSYVLFSTGHTIHGARRLIAFLGFGMNWGPEKCD